MADIADVADVADVAVSFRRIEFITSSTVAAILAFSCRPLQCGNSALVVSTERLFYCLVNFLN
ncbi:hypothetical protein ACO0K1_05940 [Undibacterium sp. SXout20W]